MSRNIRTFRDLGADDNGPDSDDSGADGERGPPQEFYAGSGQAVQGPRGARNPDEESHIRRILQSAQALTSEDAARGRVGRQEDTVTLTLNLWTDGLSIEDGPLMARQDPDTIQFLEVVGRGEIPPSIARQYPGKQIDFNINRNHSAYVTPKVKPFGGNGVRLGNVVPTVVGAGESSSIAAPIVVEDTSADDLAKQLDEAKKELNTDNAQPTTNIQVRLPNNQRLVATFNQSHTLAALRLFICTARPELIYQPFQLMNAYPPKVFDDETQTLKDANLLNSVVAIKVTPAN